MSIYKLNDCSIFNSALYLANQMGVLTTSNILKIRSKGLTTKNAILEATCFCIASEGIEKTSITEIAKKANVSRSLVAHYFPIKDQLFEHVVHYIAAQGLSFVDPKKIQNIFRPKEQLLYTVERNLDFFFYHPHYFKCFFLFYYYASIHERFRKLNTAITQRTIDRFCSLIEDILKENYNVPTVHADLTKTLAESLHRELVGAIQKFFIVTHSIPIEVYKQNYLQNLSHQIDQWKLRGYKPNPLSKPHTQYLSKENG